MIYRKQQQNSLFAVYYTIPTSYSCKDLVYIMTGYNRVININLCLGPCSVADRRLELNTEYKYPF